MLRFGGALTFYRGGLPLLFKAAGLAPRGPPSSRAYNRVKPDDAPKPFSKV